MICNRSRWYSRLPSVTVTFIVAFTSSLSLAAPSKGDPTGSVSRVKIGDIPAGIVQCSNIAPAGYKSHECLVVINRDNPSSPPTILVSGNTKIYIQVSNPHWNETIQFNSQTVQTAPQNILADILTSIVTPAGGLDIVQASRNANGALLDEQDMALRPDDFVSTADPILIEQKHIRHLFYDLFAKINDAATQLSCLEAYEATVSPDGKPKYCDQTASLNAPKAPTFDQAKNDADEELMVVLKLSYPIVDLAILDKKIQALVKDCTASPAKDDCKTAAEKAKADRYQSEENIIDTYEGDLQKDQDALLQARQALKLWQGSPAYAWSIVETKRNNSTITVAAQEVISKTSTNLATVTVNWQGVPWVLSSGILFSNLVYKTFSISPTIGAGKPPQPTGAYYIMEADQKPSIDVPIVFGSYAIPFLSRFDWEAKCPNHCAFLISGGVGANLTSKTADFAVGPSFQIGNFLFTPSAVLGRKNVLLNGLTSGQTLNPVPTSLPTGSEWTPVVGIALTYAIPTP
jgi:hypothetical protein